MIKKMLPLLTSTLIFLSFLLNLPLFTVKAENDFNNSEQAVNEINDNNDQDDNTDLDFVENPAQAEKPAGSPAGAEGEITDDSSESELELLDPEAEPEQPLGGENQSAEEDLFSAPLTANPQGLSSPAEELSSKLNFITKADGVYVQGLKEGASLNAAELAHLKIPDAVILEAGGNPSPLVGIEPYAFFQIGIQSVSLGTHMRYVGDYAFAGNQITSVVFTQSAPEDYIRDAAIQSDKALKLGEAAFKDNKISSLDTQNVTEIGEAAFLNNGMETLNLGPVVTMGDSAFAYNNLQRVAIPNSLINFGHLVFSNNNRYVLIETDNDRIESELDRENFGHIVNPVSITIRFLDQETEQEIRDSEVFGTDFTDPDGVIIPGEENLYKAPAIRGYQPVNEEIKFTVDKADFELQVYYKNVSASPVIKVEKSPTIEENGQGDKAFLLSLVSAQDLNGKDISTQIKVEPEAIDTSSPGSKVVTYTVTDEYGNTSSKEVKILVGQNWFEFPLGNDWTLGDFIYDETNPNKVLGLSETGQKKIQSNKNLILPHLNPYDGVTTIDTVAFNADSQSNFVGKGLETLADYDSTAAGTGLGNIRNIEAPLEATNNGQFTNNSLSKVTLNALEYLGPHALKNNKLAQISFPKLKVVGQSALSSNQITEISQENLPELEVIEQTGFSSNKLVSVSMPKVKRVGLATFLFNRELQDVNFPSLEYAGINSFVDCPIPKIDKDNFPSLKIIEKGAFGRNNKLNTIYLPELIEITGPAFGGSNNAKFSDEKDNLAKLEVIGGGALQNLGISELHLPNLKKIGVKAFIGNPGSDEHGKNVVIWTNQDLPSKENYLVNPSGNTGDPSSPWLEEDFTWDVENSQRVTGLTESGLAKLAAQEGKLILPERAHIVGEYAFNNYKPAIKYVKGVGVKEVEAHAFQGNQLSELTAASFPQLEKISGESAFSGNKLTKVSLPRLKIISQTSFYGNKITELDLPEVLEIGEYAFETNPLSSFSAPKVKKIGRGAFMDHKLIELSLPSVEEIEGWAFTRPYKNNASAERLGYPDKNITAYEEKSLKNLDLPSLKILHDLAFAGNGIEILNTPVLESVARRAFDKNKLGGELSLPQAKEIGPHAFASNKFDNFFATENLSSIESTAFDKNRNSNKSGRETMVFIQDHQNPHNLQDGIVNGVMQHRINPTKVTVKFVDQEGQSLQDVESINEYIYEEKVYQARDLYGTSFVSTTLDGQAVEEQKVTIPDDRKVHELIFTYTDQSHINKAGIELRQANEIDANSRLPKEVYEIGKLMQSKVYLDITDIGNYTGDRGKLKLYFDPRFIDSKSIRIPSTTASSVEKIEVKDGVIEIDLKDLQGGFMLEIPVEWKFQKFVTPQHYRMPLKVSLSLLENEVYAVAATAEPIYLEGYYTLPELLKSSPQNLSAYDTQLHDYDNGPRDMGELIRYEDATGQDGYKVDQAKQVKFDFVISQLERYVDSFQLIDKLPSYVAVNAEGQEEIRKAQFDPQANPAWTMSKNSNGETLLIQEQRFPRTASPGNLVAPLYLSFPDLKSDYNLVNEAEIVLYPHAKGSQEEDIKLSDELSIYAGFYEPIFSDGDPRFEKRHASLPHSDGLSAYFYDTASERKKILPYLLRVSSMSQKTDWKNLIITDYDLDERLYYYGVSFPSDEKSGGGITLTINAYKQNTDSSMLDPASDTLLYSQNVSMQSSNSVVFPEHIAQEISYLQIILPEDYKVFAALEFYVNTKVRNPESPLFDAGDLSDRNVFKNHAVVSSNLYYKNSTELAGERGDIVENGKTASKYDERWNKLPGNFVWGSKAQINLKDYEQFLGIRKTQSYPQPATRTVYPGETGGYSLYLNPVVYSRNGERQQLLLSEGETMQDFEMIDLLPQGLLANKVLPSQEFQRQGGQFEQIANYKETGRTALRFYAPSLSLNSKLRLIAQIETSVEPNADDHATLTNELFAKFTADKIQPDGVQRQPDWDPQNNYLYDYASIRVNKIKEMYARKYIGQEDAQGLINWRSDGLVCNYGDSFYYKLSLVNNVEEGRKNIDIVDVLPYLGDVSIQEQNIGSGIRLERNSKFANKLMQGIVVQLNGMKTDEYTLSYYNSDDPPVYNKKSADKVFADFAWSAEPSPKTKAIRITAKEGAALNTNDRLDVILPMQAPSKADDPRYDYVGEKAWNSFVRKDNSTLRFIEPNRVYNEIKITGSIEFVKYGLLGLYSPADQAQPLAGAKFEARDQDGTIYTAVSDGEGKVLFKNLPINISYDIYEVEAPEGYVPADTHKPLFSVSKDNFIKALNNEFKYVYPENEAKKNFLNKRPFYGSVKIRKQNETGEALAYIKFKVVGKSGDDEITREGLTDAQGNLSFDKLPQGEYELHEIREGGKTGYQTVDSKKFKIESENQVVDFATQPIVNEELQVYINKLAVTADFKLDEHVISDLTDFGKSKLDGYSFEIYEVENPSNIYKAGPTVKGVCSVEGLKINTLYEISEVKREGRSLYLHNSEKYQFKLDGNGWLQDSNGHKFQQNMLNIPNPEKPIEGKVSILKKDSNNQLLANAKFGLYKISFTPEGEEKVNLQEEKMSDQDGKVVFEHLASGSYLLKETSAPAGHSKSYVTKRFTVPYQVGPGILADKNCEIGDTIICKNFSYEFVNRPFDVEIIKGDTLLRNLSLEEADAKIANDPSYQKREVGGAYYDLYKPLEGVEFTLYRVEGSSRIEVGKLSSDAEGKLQLSQLKQPDGSAFTPNFELHEDQNYELIETKAQKGYALDQTPIKLNVKDLAQNPDFDGIIYRYKNNQPLKGRILISKYKEDERTSLQGAEFTLYKLDANLQPLPGSKQTAVSNQQGMVEFRELDFGSYLLKESKAPEGFQNLNWEQQLTVDEQNTSFSYIVNNPAIVSFRVQKNWVGGTGQEVKFTVLADGEPAADMQGQQLPEFSLNEGNHWQTEVKNLPKYKFINQQNPDGSFSHQPRKIEYSLSEISQDGYTISVTGSAAYPIRYFTLNNVKEGLTTIGVTKLWQGKVLEQVTVYLLANNEPTGQSVVLSAANHWQYLFADLPAKAPNGESISYSVYEEVPLGYQVEYQGNQEEGYIIINSEETKPSEPPRPSEPEETPSERPSEPRSSESLQKHSYPVDKQGQPERLPRTGVATPGLATPLVLLALATILIILRKRSC